MYSYLEVLRKIPDLERMSRYKKKETINNNDDDETMIMFASHQKLLITHILTNGLGTRVHYTL